MILSKQIELFGMTGPQSGLSIKDMNCKAMVEYLFHIEKDPYVIWKCMTEKYGPDFFISEIQNQYGVNLKEAANERSKYESMYGKLKIETQQKIKSIKQALEKEKIILNNKLAEKDEEISKMAQSLKFDKKKVK